MGSSSQPSAPAPDSASGGGNSEAWKRFASAVGGFTVGVAVNVITPSLTAQGIVLIAVFGILAFLLAYLHAKHSETRLSVVALWVFVVGAGISAVVGMTGVESGSGFGLALAALLATAAALVPQAAATMTVAIAAVRRRVATSPGIQNVVVMLLVGSSAGFGLLAVASLFESDFGLVMTAATPGVALGLVAWWWARERANLGAMLAVAVSMTLAVVAIVAAVSGDMFSGALLAALAVSFAGTGAPRLLSRPTLRGGVFVGAALFAGAAFVIGVDAYQFENYGYSDTTWMLRGLVAVLFLVGAIGIALQRRGLAAVTAAAGAAAVALAALIILQQESEEWPFYLVYGVIGITSGIATIASPASATARKWTAFLTAPRSSAAAAEQE